MQGVQSRPYLLWHFLSFPKGYFLHKTVHLTEAEKLQNGLKIHPHIVGRTPQSKKQYIFVVPDEKKDEIGKILNPPKPKDK